MLVPVRWATGSSDSSPIVLEKLLVMLADSIVVAALKRTQTCQARLQRMLTFVADRVRNLLLLVQAKQWLALE